MDDAPTGDRSRPVAPVGRDGTAGAPPAEVEEPETAPLLPASRLAGHWRAGTAWLRGSRLGLVAMALVVGVVAGFGAVGFRGLIFAFTWIATGHEQFGQQGRVASLHFPWLGIWFLLLIPVVGGLLYGPLVQRFAKEARGHGVPEVMLAVSENGGRIRPPVTVVKALASALCIGTGGSVGREGPIVQIGSAFASTLGQWVRMSESRLRIIVACGAAGGIAATFNAPITGMFFGFEIILREFSLDALLATILSAVAADLVSRSFFGSAPFFSAIPHDLVVQHDTTYLLVALLGVAAGLVGYGFKTVLYKLEDVVDDLWKGRPEWARPAVGGLALGALLLALPQLYGVGYPVMDKAVSGRVVLWLLLVLMAGKIVAASLTLSIGGSGGVFAPSLFTGAMGGMAFGLVVRDVFGPVVSSPAIFAVVAMGAVFGAAAQAPLTAIASVLEMTGNFTLVLPVMLAVGIATALSKRLSHASIYTTKLLRRGVDIERPKLTGFLATLTVSDAMLPIPEPDGAVGAPPGYPAPASGTIEGLRHYGSLVEFGPPQVLFDDETLDQALRQLELTGRVGLPVLSADAQHLRGWITPQNVLRLLAEHVGSARREAERGRLASEFGDKDPSGRLHEPRTPLDDYETVELSVTSASTAVGRRIDQIPLPAGAIVVALSEGREPIAARPEAELRPGDRLIALVPRRDEGDGQPRPEHRSAPSAASGEDHGPPSPRRS